MKLFLNECRGTPASVNGNIPFSDLLRKSCIDKKEKKRSSVVKRDSPEFTVSVSVVV